jgi:ATP-binding cassette subfamily B protein
MNKEKDRKEASIKESFKAINYIFKIAFHSSKKYVFFFVTYILTSILAPLVLLFIPTLAVYFLSVEKNLTKFAIYLSIAFAAYIGISGTSHYVSSRYDIENTLIRLKDFFTAFINKSLVCDYSYYEEKQGKEDRKKAEHCLDSNWLGVELIMKDVPLFLINFLSLIIYIASSSLVSYQIVLIMLAMVIANFLLGYLSTLIYNKYIDRTGKSYNRIDYLYRTSKNELKGKDIRNYNLAGLFNSFFIKEFNLLKKYTLIQRSIVILPNLSNSLLGYIRDLVAYSILITGVVNKSLSVAQFTLLIGIVNGISTYLTDLFDDVNDIMVASKDTLQYLKFINAPSAFNHNKGIDINSVSKPLTVEFKNVSFKYHDSKDNTIENVSFKINAGEKIALVGANGAGKTTIIKLLSGFYKPTSGEILISGHPISDFNIDEYYRLLSIINQDVEVIGVRIKDIVSSQYLDKNIDEEKVVKCLKEADLFDKVDSLPEKDRTYLTQNLDKSGIQLSGGESQKLMLARALYKDGSFLMLDEPTSALDPIAEGKLYEQYASLCYNKTSLFISHRLSSTKFCNNIIYLKDGKIVEEGTHEELMKKKGEYYHVFSIQSHYYKNQGELNESLL